MHNCLEQHRTTVGSIFFQEQLAVLNALRVSSQSNTKGTHRQPLNEAHIWALLLAQTTLPKCSRRVDNHTSALSKSFRSEVYPGKQLTSMHTDVPACK